MFDSGRLRAGDLLIVSAGFEERALTVLQIACATGIKQIDVICFDYNPIIDQNRSGEIAALCDRAGWRHRRITYDRCNPRGIYDSVCPLLSENLGRIFIDISGMSRLLIVQLVAGILQRATGSMPCSILYTVAAHYPPTEQEAQAEIDRNSSSSSLLSFVSAGVFDLAVVPELASSTLHQAPVRLIAFPSLNPAQLLNVRASIQPSQLSLIYGSPPDPAHSWRTSIIAKLNRIDDEIQHQDLTVSTLNYADTLRVLLQLYDQWAEFNTLMLSPTGSKMQTVATGIFRAFISDVQIVYPTPLRFTNPEAYTQGAKETYELELDLFSVCGTMFRGV